MDTHFFQDTEFAQIVETILTSHSITQETNEIKARLKATWMAGDYDLFSRYMERDARAFYERLHVPAGAKFLDVGCGSGQLALWAARDGAKVTGVDIATNLIKRAQARANAEDLPARFMEGDAEYLPFEDARFDVVASLIGAMFAPQPDLVAQELLRVCHRGGIIAMANWTPEGFVGQMFKAFAKFLAPSGAPSPTLWGKEEVVRERLGAGLSNLSLVRRNYVFNYPFSPVEVVDFFRQYYGPTNRAFVALNLQEQNKLRAELETLWTSHNRGSAEFTVVNAEYLEVIGIKK